MFCIRDHYCWTILLVYSNHRHSVRYDQMQKRNKKSDDVGRQHAISVMSKRSPFAVPTSAAILKRSRRLKIFVHLCQFLYATFLRSFQIQQEWVLVFICSTNTNGKCSIQNWTSLKDSFGLEISKTFKFMQLWQLISYIRLLILYRGQIYFSWLPCNKYLNYVLTRQFPPVSSWIQWMTHDNPSSVVL